jgi:hypothetical protein
MDTSQSSQSSENSLDSLLNSRKIVMVYLLKDMKGLEKPSNSKDALSPPSHCTMMVRLSPVGCQGKVQAQRASMIVIEYFGSKLDRHELPTASLHGQPLCLVILVAREGPGTVMYTSCRRTILLTDRLLFCHSDKKVPTTRG